MHCQWASPCAVHSHDEQQLNCNLAGFRVIDIVEFMMKTSWWTSSESKSHDPSQMWHCHHSSAKLSAHINSRMLARSPMPVGRVDKWSRFIFFFWGCFFRIRLFARSRQVPGIWSRPFGTGYYPKFSVSGNEQPNWILVWAFIPDLKNVPKTKGWISRPSNLKLTFIFQTLAGPPNRVCFS